VPEVKAPSLVRTMWAAMLVCAACYAGATVGISFRFPVIGTAIFFPPYAILTASLLLSPPRRWWIYLLASTAGNFWPHYADGAPISFVLVAELANYARALVAACGIRRFGDANGRFDTLRGMAWFLFFAVVLAPALAAFIGAGAVMIHNGSDTYWPAWRPWFLSNTLTGLTLLPIILTGVAEAKARRRSVSLPALLEGGAITLALIAVGWLVLVRPSGLGTNLPIALYVPLPFLLWAAVRFGPRGTSASLLTVAVLVTWATTRGRGPFATESPDGDLLHLQLFLFVVAVPLLLLSALLEEQQRTRDALRASQRHYRAVVEDQTELVCRFRADGTLTFVNGAFCRASERSAANLLGTSFWSLVSTEQRDDRQRIVLGLSSDKPMATWEHEIITSAGESRWEQWRVRAIFDDQRHLTDYQAVGRDTTERRRAEEQQRLLEAERVHADALREADRRKDDFLAVLAHELRNPLAPISMVVEVLRRSPTKDEQVRWARDVIGRQVGQLKRLGDDLLDVSRITRGSIEVHLETVDLVTIISRAIETSRPLIDSRSLALSTDIPLAPVLVRGDAVRLAQLMSNLLHNAAKYSNVGERIRLTVEKEDAQLVVRFKDSGVGIPPNMLQRIFEPFTQVNRSRDGSMGGLGLGLALVSQLVKLHDGTVEAHSEGVGKGSEFVVRLPALQASPAAQPIVGKPDRGLAPAVSQDHREPARRILVVDDTIDAADSLARFLTLRGHHVDVVHDGATALDAALRDEHEVVFLDLDLPKMDGLEVARRLRTRYGSEQMLIVATTGFGQPEDQRRTSEAGFDHHLTKPIDTLAVQALLEVAVSA